MDALDKGMILACPFTVLLRMVPNLKRMSCLLLQFSIQWKILGSLVTAGN